MAKVTRGEKVLAALVAQDKISATGRDWLVAAIDPFHDNQLDNLEGWPDTESGASVVRCVKQSVSVSVPGSVAANANWDCHVLQWPMVTSGYSVCQPFNRTNCNYQGVAFPLVAPNGPIGGLQAYGMPAGNDLNIIQAAGSGNVVIGTIGLDTTYSKGAGRLIGIGFEIHNTTAEIYKQGTLTCYRQQADSRDVATFFGTNGVAYTSVYAGAYVRHPPVNTREALTLQGSRQWEAKDGAYVVAPFSTIENPAIPASPIAPIILPVNSDDVEAANNTSLYFVPVPQALVAGTSISPVKTVRIHPIHQTGVILTGLSYNTTLTINQVLFYESFPSNSSPDIVVMAKPSAKFDPCVMELYSRIVQSLPVAVPVAENGLGDWFLSAATKAAQYLGPVLTALPHPIAKGAGALATFLGNTGEQYIKRNNATPSSGTIPAPNSWGRPPKGRALTAEQQARADANWAEAGGMNIVPAYSGGLPRPRTNNSKKARKRLIQAQAQAASRKSPK